MNISELFDVYGVYIMIAAVVIVVIFIAVKIKSEHDTDSTLEVQKFDGQEYKQTVLNSVPEYYRLDYSNLLNKIDSLNKRTNRIITTLDEQEIAAIDSINSRINESQNKIEKYWNSLQQRRNFYYCIGVHYASFTLANKIKREQEQIRDSFVKLKQQCDSLHVEIENLNNMIDSSHGSQRYEIQKRHKALCSKHKRLCKLKSIFGSRNAQYLSMVNEQNRKTAEYRNYIIHNFGSKGRKWGKKLKARKLDQR